MGEKLFKSGIDITKPQLSLGWFATASVAGIVVLAAVGVATYGYSVLQNVSPLKIPSGAQYVDQ